MKTTVAALFGFFLFLSFGSLAQNAPVVTAGSAMYASPASTSIPITVKDFLDIGSFTLTLKYQVPYASYVGVTPNPAFTGMSVNSSTPGTLVISWFGSGLTLPDDAHLLDLTFNYPYTYYQSILSWDTLSGTSCMFKKYEGGSYISMIDSPKNQHYINGIINYGAPTVYAPVITNAVPGAVIVPVTVTHFGNIGSVTLTLVYDPTVLTLNSAVPNYTLNGTMNVGSQPAPGGKSKIVINYYNGSNGLTDGSVLVTLNFQYTNVTNNYSALSWLDTQCIYTTPEADVLLDSPTSFFFHDGLVAGQLTPQTILPKLSNANAGTPVPVPITVNNFTNIRAVSLSFKYDPSVVTLPDGAFTPNPAFGGNLTLTNTPSGPDGKGRIAIAWSSATPVTLANGSSLVTMNFDYNTGNTALVWNTGGDSCDYKGAYSKSLWKNPVTTYYQDGIVSHHLAPVTKVDSVTATTPGQTVSVPVIITGFANIASFTLTMNYDPGVLSYNSTTPNALLGGSFTATSIEPGQVRFVWTGTAKTLTDGVTLMNLYFTYHGGTSSFQWYTNASACIYGEGAKSVTPFDEPKPGFYINGAVTSPINALVVNLKVYLEGAYDITPGTMKTVLSTYIPLSQPYTGSPWNYHGTEHVASIPADVTDWILVELKNTIPWGTSFSRAGFLKKDGSIVAVDGASLLSFAGVSYGSYFVVVKHRNHMPVMSSEPISLSSGSALYDFSTGSSKAYGGTSGYKRIDAGRSRWGMIAGDANNDGKVFINDYTDYWVPAFGLTGVYNLGDLKLDGNVFIDDYTDGWVPNFGKTNVLP